MNLWTRWTICLKVLLSSFKMVKCTILILWLIHHLSLIFNVLPFLMLTMVILFLKNSESSKKPSSKSSSVSFKVFHKVLSSSWYLQNVLKGILRLFHCCICNFLHSFGCEHNFLPLLHKQENFCYKSHGSSWWEWAIE